MAGSIRRYLSIIAAVAIGAAAAPTPTTAASAQVRPLATACASAPGPHGLNTRFAVGHRTGQGRRLPTGLPAPGRADVVAVPGRLHPRPLRRRPPRPQHRAGPIGPLLHAPAHGDGGQPPAVDRCREDGPTAALVLAARRHGRRRRDVQAVPRRDGRARTPLPQQDRARRHVDRHDQPAAPPGHVVASRSQLEPAAVRVERRRPRRLHLLVRALLPAVRVELPRPPSVRRQRQGRPRPPRPARRETDLLERRPLVRPPPERGQRRPPPRPTRRGPRRQPDADRPGRALLDRGHQGRRLVRRLDLSRPGPVAGRAVADRGGHSGSRRSVRPPPTTRTSPVSSPAPPARRRSASATTGGTARSPAPIDRRSARSRSAVGDAADRVVLRRGRRGCAASGASSCRRRGPRRRR